MVFWTVWVHHKMFENDSTNSLFKTPLRFLHIKKTWDFLQGSIPEFKHPDESSSGMKPANSAAGREPRLNKRPLPGLANSKGLRCTCVHTNLNFTLSTFNQVTQLSRLSIKLWAINTWRLLITVSLKSQTYSMCNIKWFGYAALHIYPNIINKTSEGAAVEWIIWSLRGKRTSQFTFSWGTNARLEPNL